MYLISQLTQDPLQNTTLILPNGNPCQLTINYNDRQIGWFITNLTYGTFVLNGIRITTSPNFLSQWRNIIPFGMACYTTNNFEPTHIQDFFSGYATLYILDQTEVEDITELISNG